MLGASGYICSAGCWLRFLESRDLVSQSQLA